MRTTIARRMLTGIAALAVAASLAGCVSEVPGDPGGTLDAVTGGELRVGASPDPGLVDTGGTTPTGPLPDLVTAFADSIDADPVWTVASEETLVTELEDGQLDLLIGGFTDQTPWTDKAGVTRGYTDIAGADGRSVVLLVPLGENAFLSALERFLDEEVGR